MFDGGGDVVFDKTSGKAQRSWIDDDNKQNHPLILHNTRLMSNDMHGSTWYRTAYIKQ